MGRRNIPLQNVHLEIIISFSKTNDLSLLPYLETIFFDFQNDFLHSLSLKSFTPAAVPHSYPSKITNFARQRKKGSPSSPSSLDRSKIDRRGAIGGEVIQQ